MLQISTDMNLIINKIMKHTRTINGRTYDIISRGWSTSRSWGHKSELYIDGNFVEEGKVRYYNRTWESYQFRTCMQNLIWGLIERTEKKFLDQYKKDNDIKRLTASRKEEALKSEGEGIQKVILRNYKDFKKM